MSAEGLREALRDAERKGQYREWVRQRIETIKSSVTAHDVCRHFGTPLKYAGSNNEEQISCPFHGKDTKPSARIFPDTGSSSSHIWCYVCAKRWDVIGLWKKYMGEDEGSTHGFTATLFAIERAFGIVTPEGPSLNDDRKPRGPSEEELEVRELLRICESRMREAKSKWEPKGFLRVGQLLDKMHYEVTHHVIPFPEAKARLKLILDKIGEKIRA